MISSDEKVQQRASIKLAPLTIAMILALPAVAHSADLSMKNGKIYNANGVPVVDINKANSSGLSHNVWDNLNVDKKGLIFNNSASATSTLLGGDIQGNSNLSGGTAKVILNEVTSKNMTTINGMMEVAGDKAGLIIANPNGITVSGGGSINASKLTLTTGKPDIKDDELNGFSVNGGTITLGKLDSASPTEILSRNVVINGKVSADELNVVAGNNYVNTAGEVTGKVTATGKRNGYSVDVAKLGGMYANKINLVSTESGVGVRNLGVIVGGEKGISIDANGQLLNSNAQIKSEGIINLKTKGSLENTTGTIASNKTISIDTNKNKITNTRAGKITTFADIYVNSGAIDNTNGKIAAGGVLAVNTNKNTLTNSGKGNNVGIEAGIVALETGTLNNSNGQIRGEYMELNSAYLNNNNGILETNGDIIINSSDNIDNNKGLIRSASGRINMTAAKSVNNKTTKTADTNSADTLGIASETGVKIVANAIYNNGGQIASNGDVSLESRGMIDNDSGKVMSNAKAIVKGSSVRNDNGGISGKQGTNVTVDGNLTNYIGVISSEEGDVALKANTVNNYGGFITAQNISIDTKGELNNSTALIVANKKLTVNAGTNIQNRNSNNFGNNFGLYFGMPQQNGGMIGKEGVNLTANNIYNNYSRIISEKGSIDLNSRSNFENNNAQLVSGGDAVIKVGNTFNNNYATTYSAGNLSINTTNLSINSNGNFLDNNATGIIASDKDLILNVTNNLNNTGWISGKGNVTLNVLKGQLNNRNTIAADKSLTITASNGIENSKDISSGGTLTLDSKRSIVNNNNSSIVGYNIVMNANNDITNRSNIVSDADMKITAKGNLNNYLNLVSYGDVAITANSVNNNNSVIDAKGALSINSAGKIGNSRGTLRSQTGDMSLVSTNNNIDNYYGYLISGGKIAIKGNNLNNDNGLIGSNGDMNISLKGSFDNGKGSVSSNWGDVVLNANSVDNNNGFISGKNVSVDSKSTIYNNDALISAYKVLTVNANGNVENKNGNNFNRDHGAYFDLVDSIGGMSGKEGLNITAQNIYNNNSNLIAEKGALTLNSRGVFDNTSAKVISGADNSINVAGVFYNNYATVYSEGNLDIKASKLENLSNGSMEKNNATGVIASDKNLNLTIDNSFTNYGWISGKGDVNLNVLKGAFYNRNTLSADKAMTINTLSGVENYKDIVAGTTLTVNTEKHITNSNNSNMLGKDIVMNAVNNIVNHGNIVSDYSLIAKTAGDIYNYLNMLSYGVAKVTAKNVVNSDKDAVLGGFYGLELESEKTTNTGTLVGM